MIAKANKDNENQREVVGFLGVGLDGGDQHTRITTTENFYLYGGSQETHERMADTAIYFNEGLRSRGKQLEEAEPDEVLDLLREALDR